MNILESVLNNCVPVEWEETNPHDYQTARYILYDVRVGEEEYSNEVNAFVNGDPPVEVKAIQRVQNPFQLGRFILRKEQMRFRGEHLEVLKYYHPLCSVDKDIALEYNMDVRKYNNKQSGQMCARNPKFYKTPGQAFNSISSCQEILICNVLGRTYEGSTTYKTNDTEYMPTYVVKVV